MLTKVMSWWPSRPFQLMVVSNVIKRRTGRNSIRRSLCVSQTEQWHRDMDAFFLHDASIFLPTLRDRLELFERKGGLLINKAPYFVSSALRCSSSQQI